MIIDHLFLFATEAAAHLALDPLGYGFPASGTQPAGWDGSRVLPCKVIVAYTAGTDAKGNPTSTPVYMDGFHINVALTDVSADLMAMPECVMITDRDHGAVPGAVRADFLIYSAVSVETMDAVKGITPMFAGSGYPLGAPA